jgi:hypothetical protein
MPGSTCLHRTLTIDGSVFYGSTITTENLGKTKIPVSIGLCTPGWQNAGPIYKEAEMPSVVATWEGQCKDHQVQEDLTTEIRKLATRSQRMYREYFKQKVDPIFHDGGKVYHKVLLARNLFHRHTVPAGLRLLKEDGYFQKQITLIKPDGTVRSSGFYEEVYLLENVSFFGIDFQLYDPRAYNYPFGLMNSEETSFVFLRCEHPELDGKLVRARDLNPQGALAPFGEKLLTTPELDLRYYLENWTRCFLGWVKHFYIPDLYYWLWSDCGGDFIFKEYPPDDRNAAASEYQRLLRWFSREARGFTAEHEEWHKKLEQQDSQENPKSE